MNKQVVIGKNLISYLEFRNPQAEKTVVFLHGWRSNKEVWSGIESKIRNQELGIYAIDLPGFGVSSLPKEPWAVLDYAELVKEFIEKLVRQPADKNIILVGHSFGGRVGIKLASTYPNIISKLVLVDAAGFALGGGKKSFYQVTAKLVKPFFKPKFMQGLRKRIYKQLGSEDYLATPELQKTFVNVVSEDLSSDMEKINIPTLIIFGENDIDTPVDFGRRMNLKIKNSKLKILANAGHFSFLDKPEEFLKILKDFIK